MRGEEFAACVRLHRDKGDVTAGALCEKILFAGDGVGGDIYREHDDVYLPAFDGSGGGGDGVSGEADEAGLAVADEPFGEVEQAAGRH